MVGKGKYWGAMGDRENENHSFLNLRNLQCHQKIFTDTQTKGYLKFDKADVSMSLKPVLNFHRRPARDEICNKNGILLTSSYGLAGWPWSVMRFSSISIQISRSGDSKFWRGYSDIRITELITERWCGPAKGRERGRKPRQGCWREFG